MSWSWSHSPAAYDNAYYNLHGQALSWMMECVKEWREVSGDGPDLDAKDRIDKQDVADFLWEKAEQLRTCDNGGHAAWICPCGCHTVPFSLTDRGRAAKQHELGEMA